MEQRIGPRGLGRALGKGGEDGPRCWAHGERNKEERAGLVFVVGLETGFGFPSFLFLSSFSKKLKPFEFKFEFEFKPHSNYLNSNLNLNSTLALKQVRQCTSMNATIQFKLRQILIS